MIDPVAPTTPTDPANECKVTEIGATGRVGGISPDVHRAGIKRDGRVRVRPALAAAGGPLVGMSLLRGSGIRIEAVDHGEGVIRSLPGS